MGRVRVGWYAAAGLIAVGTGGCVSDGSTTESIVRSESFGAAPGSTSTTSQAPTTVSTTEPVWIPSSAEASDCADAIQFAAFVGDQKSAETWEAVGADPDRLRVHCAELADTDPREFLRLADGGAPASTSPEASIPTTSSTPRAAADPVLVEACLKRIEWGQLQNDQVYVDIWNDFDEDRALLRIACSELVADDPALGREVASEVRAIEKFISTPPSTRPPATQPPPQIQPLVPKQSSCDPNYSGCVPIASDVDCAGGSGNGPAYTGRVQVIGNDIYGLDRDNDGIACE